MAPAPRLLLDCDTGIDDAVALTWLCAAGHQPVACTTTAGNTTAEQAGFNTKAVLYLLGCAEVEVAVGQPAPLVVDLITTEETHGDKGLGHATLPDIDNQLSRRDWREVWQEQIFDHPGATTLLITGPLTNFALALRQWPQLPDFLAGVVILGGAFNHPGNTTPTAEWNCYVDPHAAAEVYRAYEGRPIDQLPLVCSLAVAEPVFITMEQIDRWRNFAHPIFDLLCDALQFYVEFHDQWGYGKIAQLPDLVAAVVAAQAVEYHSVATWVGVEADSKLTRGTTCADLRQLWHKPANARLVSAIDPVLVLAKLEQAFDRLRWQDRFRES